MRAREAAAVAMFVGAGRGAGLEDRGRPPLKINVDGRRTPALLLSGLLCGAAALWLFLEDEPEAAATFVGLTWAILCGGFRQSSMRRQGAPGADRLARGDA